MLNSRTQKFLSYYQPYLRLFIADLVCAVMLSGVALLLPLCTYYITKTLLQQDVPDAGSQMLLVGGIMVALVVIHTVCDALVAYQGHMMGTYMERDMRNELFAHYQKLSFRFYDEHRTGQLMSRLTNDLFSLSELYHHGPEDLVIALTKFVGVVVILMYINLPLTSIILLGLPLMAMYALYFNRRMRAALEVSMARMGDVNAQVEDTLAGIRVAQSFTNEAVERAKFAQSNSAFVASRSATYRSEIVFYEGMTAWTQLMTIGVVILGGTAILNGSLDLADLLTYLMCVGIMIEPIQRVVNFARLYQEGLTGFNRFMDILEIEPDIQDAPGAVELLKVGGEITFEHVSFRYRDDHQDVIQNISLHIHAGEYVALVGASGVGKTTLCSLIPRFYEINAGRVLVDGVDIQAVRLASLRRNIGLVQQDVYLFAGTVAENIRYGNPEATMDEIIAAAKQANAHEFIMALPHGYDTDIGQRGVKLSGGQKQRLSIARVFLKNPPIIIFDEATSSLDNESERAVQESLERLRANRTTLVIAHRLSTVRNADRIIVLTEDGIAEQGTHEALIGAGGVYARLYDIQLELA